MSLSPECQKAVQKSFWGVLIVLVAAPTVLICLSKGKPLTILVGLLFVPAIIRAILLYLSLKRQDRQQDIERYWNQKGQSSDLSLLFILGSIPGQRNPLANSENPPQDVETYRSLLLRNQRMTWFACLIMALGVPVIMFILDQGLDRPIHWDSFVSPVGFPVLFAVQAFIRRLREQKNLSHYDRWIAEGSPTQFDPWQSKPKRR